MKKYLLIPAIILIISMIIGCQRNGGQTQNNTTQTTPGQTTTQQVGPPTVLNKGVTPKEHVDKYFSAYKEKRFDDAFALQPAENKAKQTKKDFISLRSSLPIDDYNIVPARKEGGQTIIDVEYEIGQYGTWVSRWIFEKDDGRWTALKYSADPKR